MSAGRRPRPTAGAALLAIVVAGLLFALVVPVRTYLSQRGQVTHLQRQELVLRQQNTSLQRQVRELHDPAYLEQMARQCLGMARPGEIAFTVVPKGGSGSANDSAGAGPGC